jgi:hypothetical protein
MSQTTILEGPDGRLYEIPNHTLAEFAVPGERVAELRKRMAQASRDHKDPHDPHDPHDRPAATPDMPAGHAAAPPASMTVNPGGGVVFNFYFQASPPPPPPSGPSSDDGVHGYHMTFDENGIPVNHTDMLWGDYIDKQGNPAVGWHSHDPVTGNAQ